MRNVLLAACAALVVGTGAGAQSLEAIRERAAFLEEYQALLTSETVAIQRAALDEGLKSGDGVVRKLAMDFALGSEDTALRTQALAAYVSTLPTFSVRFEVSDEATEDQQDLAAFWNPLAVVVSEFDAATNEFSGKTDGRATYPFAGRVIDNGIEFVASRTGFSLQVASPTLLIGTATTNDAILPVTVALQ